MARIKAEKMNPYEPYTHKDSVYLDCPQCGEEYEWLSPFTVSSIDFSEEVDMTKNCRFHTPTPQARCINCQVKLRLEQAERKHNK